MISARNINRYLALLCVGLLCGACGSDDTSGGQGETDASADATSDTQGPSTDTQSDAAGDGDTGLSENCAPGAACDDGDSCTFGDRCDAKGVCAGTPYECQDGRPCTEDSCDGLGNCVFAIKEGHCLAGNICYAEGESPTFNACVLCDPATPTTLVFSEAQQCDDGNSCTFGDMCEQGQCGGAVVQCDDGSPCTDDWCDPTAGCIFTPNFADCDDGDACTLGEHCGANGGCVPAQIVNCDDGNPCTADLCMIGGQCEYIPISAFCTDNDVCTVGDVCVEGECVPGAPNPCNDGNSCTADFCDSQTGCSHAPNDNPCCIGGFNPCDDGNACTIDLCGDGPDECFYEPFPGLCSDGDACTVSDTCVGGECVGEPLDCDDGNVCTLDSCIAGNCLHTPGADGEPCDDALECSTGDQCQAGQCVADTTDCQCVPKFSTWVSKFSDLAIGTNGQPGQGLDVDGKPATCSPASNCSAGIDNALSVIASFANDALADAVASGSLVLLLEHAGWTPGQGYKLNVFVGEPVNSACNLLGPGCAYWVSPDALDDECQPLVQVSGATISTGPGNTSTLKAGGPGNNLKLPLPIAGLNLVVTLYNVRIEAAVTQPGTPTATLQGVLAGAILKTELKAAISALPDDTFAPPLDKATILGFVDFLITSDIDTNNDGVPDAASIGLPFSAVGGSVTGVAP